MGGLNSRVSAVLKETEKHSLSPFPLMDIFTSLFTGIHSLFTYTYTHTHTHTHTHTRTLI